MEHKQVSKALLSLIVTVFHYYGTDSVAQSPHPKCVYSNATRIQKCSDARFIIPDDFKVNLIHREATGLEIASSRSNAGKSEIRGLVTVPYLPYLHRIALRGFRLASGRRLPIRQMFYANKDHIRRLLIQSSEIGYLDKEFLKGFKVLEMLWLDENDIATVDKDTFRECCHHLKIVNLNRNRLEVFSWDVFQPIAPYVQEIHLRKQAPDPEKGRSRLWFFEHQSNFTLQSVLIVDMAENELKGLSAGVLASLNATSLRIFNLKHNPFCVAYPTCTCCEMKPLSNWMQSVAASSRKGQPGYTLDFHCGGIGVQNTWSFDSTKTETVLLPGIMDKCDELQTRTPSMSIPPQRNSTATDLIACDEMEPIRSRCDLRKLSPPPDMTAYETIKVVLDADASQECRSLMHDAHTTLLEIAANNNTEDRLGSEDVVVHCRQGVISVSNSNPEYGYAKRLIFNSEPSLVCSQQLHKFLEKIEEYYAIQQQPEPIRRPVVVANYTKREELCSDSPPIKFRCVAGNITLSTDRARPFELSNAVKMEFNGDGSFRCQQHLKQVHKWLLETQNPVPNNEVAWADTVVALCQQGNVTLSVMNFDVSSAGKLAYYTHPNLKCRTAFVDFLNFVATLK